MHRGAGLLRFPLGVGTYGQNADPTDLTPKFLIVGVIGTRCLGRAQILAEAMGLVTG
jgi:hypothetical protein